jgi:hypothetical protein
VASASSSYTTLVSTSLCYQLISPTTGTLGTITPFTAPSAVPYEQSVNSTYRLLPAADTAAPGAGGYRVGFCARTVVGATSANIGDVNGWIMVTNS